MSPDIAHLVLGADWSISAHLSALGCFVVSMAAAVFILLRFANSGFPLKNFEIDEAEFGLGDHKIKLRPNYADRQLAYAIWVELSTRKVGLPIDLGQDVIVQIYDSWHEFFAVTRELIKGLPVSRVNRDSTEKVIRVSIELLNEGLRPHLTRWQARFRRWYDRQLTNSANDDLSPQEIQAKFSDFCELERDLMEVNTHLIAYRKKMRELIRTA